jgi:hypothetical protein
MACPWKDGGCFWRPNHGKAGGWICRLCGGHTDDLQTVEYRTELGKTLAYSRGLVSQIWR